MSARSIHRSRPAHGASMSIHAASLFAVDLRELGRRAGSMRPLHRDVAAPAGWSLDLVGVPEGVPVQLDLRLESVMEGVLVSGTLSAPVTAECGRCLELLRTTVTAPIQELYSYEPDPEDDEIPLIVGDVIDLEPTLRDAVVLSLPFSPVCSLDCRGLCVVCGEKLADLPDDHGHEQADPRWAALHHFDPSSLNDHKEN